MIRTFFLTLNALVHSNSYDYDTRSKLFDLVRKAHKNKEKCSHIFDKTLTIGEILIFVVSLKTVVRLMIVVT